MPRIIMQVDGGVLPVMVHQAQVGCRLRMVILAAGLRYVDAARIMGVSKSNVGNWMRGDAPAPAYAIYRLWRVTGATPDWVFLGDPSGLPPKMARRLHEMTLDPQPDDDDPR